MTHLGQIQLQQKFHFERECSHAVKPISISIKTGEMKYVCTKCKIQQEKPKQLRVKGKYASKLQKAEHEAKKWRSQSEMLMSILQGQYRVIRLLNEQIKELRQ